MPESSIRGADGARDAAATTAAAGTYLAMDGFAVSTLTVVGFNDEQIGQMLGVVEGALKDMTNAATISARPSSASTSRRPSPQA